MKNIESLRNEIHKVRLDRVYEVHIPKIERSIKTSLCENMLVKAVIVQFEDIDNYSLGLIKSELMNAGYQPNFESRIVNGQQISICSISWD